MNFQAFAIVTSIFVSSFVTHPVLAVPITPTPSLSFQEATPPAKIEYTLPYPGILSDHPLYFLKRLRDQIMERLIADPVRKVEFYMLQADKNINMGIFFAAKQKETLSAEALLQGQKNFEYAVRAASEIKSQGKEVPSYLLERFASAAVKYEEVFTELNTENLIELVRKLSEEGEKLK